MELEDIRLQVGWVYVGAWWGQKAEMLKKCWFLKLFLKGQKGHEDAKTANKPPSRVSSGSVWVSVGDFGSLDDYFGTIVESLWVR